MEKFTNNEGRIIWLNLKSLEGIVPYSTDGEEEFITKTIIYLTRNNFYVRETPEQVLALYNKTRYNLKAVPT